MATQDNSPALAQYLAGFEPQVRQTERWPRAEFTLTAAITQELPPEKYIMSVRAVMFKQGRVMVITDPNHTHLMPGGRREPDETVKQTLARELFEETGYAIRSSRLLGVMWFEHKGPKPDVSPSHLYPHFFHLIYHVRAGVYHADRRERDGFEITAEFRPLASLADLELDAVTRLFLDESLKVEDQHLHRTHPGR